MWSYEFLGLLQSSCGLDYEPIALDGPLAVAACTEGECDLEEFCGASAVWRQASEAFEGVLAATSVADLAERERQLRAGQPMYQI